MKGFGAKMRRFFFLFLDEYRLNFIFVKFFITLNYYHAKSLKSNFLTPKSYSAPATVKFYTVSNFGRANKLQTSWEAGKLQILEKKSWSSTFQKPIFLTYKI